jgi:hypothetical protein
MAIAVTMGILSAGGSAFGQAGGFFRQPVVGGVRIDADGVMRAATIADQNKALAELRQTLAGPQGELQAAAATRMISLKNIQETVSQARKNNTEIPEETLFLGGLTRVEYIYVYPERNDIVLSGPSEPWTVGANGAIVGTKSGRPIVLLDDLLNAMKSVHNAERTGISVSIEPTEQGVVRLNQLLSQVRDASQANWKRLEAAMCEAFGPQQIKLEGVSSDSHIARIILAADYKMKLYGMKLAEPPVAGLPSYLDMVRNTSSKDIQSRWWMACDYTSIEHSDDRLAWKITGPGIKTLTEQEQYAADGSVKGLGKVDPIAKKWADTFTAKLDELSVKDPVFGQLRNVMDLCVVAAIIESNRLQDLAACDLSMILGDSADVETAKLDIPQSLDPQCSFVKANRGFLVSASGGVLVDSWQVASTAKPSTSLVRTDAAKEWKNPGKIWQ